MADLESKSGKKYSREVINDRLRELEAMKNKCRARAKGAIDDEKRKEIEGERGAQRREEQEQKEKDEKFRQSLVEQGVDPERYYRLQTTLEVQNDKEKRTKKKVNPGDIDLFGEEAQYRAFKKRKGALTFDKDAYDKQKESLGSDFYDCSTAVAYGVDSNDDPRKVLAMVDELRDTDDRRKNFSRRRKWDEDSDISFINERNRKFNQKVGRYYDNYTAEIRENLERGTAL